MRTSPQPVRLDQVSRQFGPVRAVEQVSLDVAAGAFFSLLGPSGCGKSTLLRLVGGFETPDAGRIFLGEADVTRVPARHRPTAMVFQSYALFPTMTVGQNVGYGLAVQKIPNVERARRVAESLARVDLAGYEPKPVTQLSGGQQQRVALARALAVEPAVLLFDEPLSNLDVALREQTRRELKALQAQLGVTSLYVTHDQEEALALSDRLAVMRAGRIVQVGTPAEVYQRPETAFVARFLGGSNLVASPRLAALLAPAAPAPPGHVLAVRPEHLRITPDGPVAARLCTRQFLGAHAEWWLEAEGELLRARVDPGLEPAEVVYLTAVQSCWVRQDETP
jgi:ABC-type Fe3+/spermidine/putrescine transport system ATPase subunit